MPAGTVKLYYDNGETAVYTPRSMLWELTPEGVGIVTFNDPKTLNALTPNFQSELFIMLEHAKRDPAVKAVVWAANGKAWSSGAALRGDRSVDMPKDLQSQYRARGMFMVDGDVVMKAHTLAFWDFPKPSICAVHGMAVGGAINMVVANYHDIVYAAEGTRFKYPFVKLGLTPELGSSRMLPFLIGTAKAKELLMFGDWFGAEEAARLNLVNRVLPQQELVPAAVAAATRLAKEPNQMAIRLGKQVVNGYLRADLPKVLDEENRTLTEALKHVQGSTIIIDKPNAKM